MCNWSLTLRYFDVEAAAACGHDYAYFTNLDKDHERSNFEDLDLDYLEVGFHDEVMKWIKESELPLPRDEIPERLPPALTRGPPVDIEIGTTFTKFFPGYGNFLGIVMSQDKSSGWYLVQYSDGDSEQLEPVELHELVGGNRNQQSHPKSPWASNPGCQWNDHCSACGDDKVEPDDELLKCFFCPKVQHLNCIPIASGLVIDIPGEWLCPACSQEYRAGKD